MIKIAPSLLAADFGKIHEEIANTKKKHDNHEERFDKLLGYLKDESPECRIAAAETLGQCSREVAVTYLCQYIQTEQDENVVKAMKAAISSIRENIRRNR